MLILSNDKKQAVSYLSKFSNLTRTILEMTEKETISIAEEVKTLGTFSANVALHKDHNIPVTFEVVEE